MKKQLGLILCLLVVLVLGFIGWRSCKQDNDADVRIACNVPINGDLATYGESIRDGMLLAKEDLAAIDSSFVLSLDIQDNASDATTALTIFNGQKQKGNDIYVSGVKPQTMSIIDEVEKLSIPHFVWIFDAYVTQRYANAYRCWVNYRVEAEYIKRFVQEKESKRIAIVYVQLPHTDELVNDILVPFFKDNDIQYFLEPYDADKMDFKDIAAKVKNDEIDALYVNGFKYNLIGIAKAFEEYQINVNCDNLYTYDFMDAKDDLSEEIISHINYLVPDYEVEMTPRKEAWQKRFVAKYRRQPRYTDAYAYDMVFAIYYAHMKGIPIEDVSFDGITGHVDFDDSGDIVTKLFIINYSGNEIHYVLQ